MKNTHLCYFGLLEERKTLHRDAGSMSNLPRSLLNIRTIRFARDPYNSLQFAARGSARQEKLITPDCEVCGVRRTGIPQFRKIPG